MKSLIHIYNVASLGLLSRHEIKLIQQIISPGRPVNPDVTRGANNSEERCRHLSLT